MVFNPAPFYHVRNDETSIVFLIVCGFIGLWHMPLFFLLAGWSAAASLQSRGVGLFLRERFRKLAVPLVAGCVSFMPVIKFLELRSGQDLNHEGLFVTPELLARMRTVIPIELPQADAFDESFLSFLPTFFTQLDRFTWSHLWFVAYLLVLTLLLLPAFVRLARRGPGPAAIARAWVYVPILPLVVIQLALRERFPGPYNLYRDWANVLFFVTFLCSGFAMSVVPALEERVRSEWRRALALGAAATAVLLAAVLGAFQSTPVVLAGSAVAGWCFVVALLGFARERITRSGPRLRYLAESAFPIYVLHQPVVVVLGAAVVTLPLGISAKFVMLLAGSIAATLAIYHFGVRPFGVPRFALGMKPLPRVPTQRPVRPCDERRAVASASRCRAAAVARTAAATRRCRGRCVRAHRPVVGRGRRSAGGGLAMRRRALRSRRLAAKPLRRARLRAPRRREPEPGAAHARPAGHRPAPQRARFAGALGRVERRDLRPDQRSQLRRRAPDGRFRSAARARLPGHPPARPHHHLAAGGNREPVPRRRLNSRGFLALLGFAAANAGAWLGARARARRAPREFC